MKNDELVSVKKLPLNILRFIRDNIFILFIFLSYLFLLPLQVILWLKNKKPWGRTEPYLFLNYLLNWCEATDKSKILPYTVWKNKKR